MKNNKIDTKKVLPEYTFNAYAMDDGDEDSRGARLLYIVSERLTASERNILVLYAEYESLRKLGEHLNLSHTTMSTEIRRIREKVISIYKELYPNDLH